MQVKIFFVIGMIGQLIFSSRFIVQWIHSEKHKKSMIPNIFWYLSFVGSILLLVYAISRKDFVFTLGQLPGPLIYGRNIFFIRKGAKL